MAARPDRISSLEFAANRAATLLRCSSAMRSVLTMFPVPPSACPLHALRLRRLLSKQNKNKKRSARWFLPPRRDIQKVPRGLFFLHFLLGRQIRVWPCLKEGMESSAYPKVVILLLCGRLTLRRLKFACLLPLTMKHNMAMIDRKLIFSKRNLSKKRIF